MDAEARAWARTAACDEDVDGAAAAWQALEDLGRRAVAQRRVVADGEQRRVQQAAPAGGEVGDGVDPAEAGRSAPRRSDREIAESESPSSRSCPRVTFPDCAVASLATPASTSGDLRAAAAA